MSCQQAAAAGSVMRDVVPLVTPLEEMDCSNSESFHGTENVENCSNCCANFSCMYHLINDGFKESKELKTLGDLIYLSGDEIPTFIPVKVNLTWTECKLNTSTVKKVSKKWSYVWGRNPTYATFGPVQEFFQSVILFDPVFKLVALLEQGLVPIVHLREDHLEDCAIEHDQTLTVDISGMTCISQADILKQPLVDTVSLVTEEALATVSGYDVMNCCMV